VQIICLGNRFSHFMCFYNLIWCGDDDDDDDNDDGGGGGGKPIITAKICY